MTDDAAATVEPESTTPAEAQALLEPLPEVNPAAIAAAEQKTQETATAEAAPVDTPAAPAAPEPIKFKRSKPAPVDKNGRPHDPLIHETREDGSPVFRDDGVTLKLRRTPLKEWKRTSRVNLDPPAPPQAAADGALEAATPEERAMELQASGATLAGLQLMMMKAALGPKIGDEEAQREELCRAWVRIFKHYGMAELHPVMGLAMVTGGIVVAGLQHEETQGRFQKVSNWFQHRMLSFWQWLTGRRRQKPADEADETAQQE